jgi:NADH-quinone oxidoreductase subunit D
MSNPRKCSSTWARSIPARTACCAWSCAPTAKWFSTPPPPGLPSSLQGKDRRESPYYQFIGYTDRLDYLSAMNNNHAWSMAVEKLAGIEVPIRAEFIRVLAAELNRIASHLVSFGTYGLDMGAFTPFLYAFREREYILDFFEQLCGARLTLSYINVGGVTWDLPPAFLEKLKEFLDYFEPKIDEYNELLTFNHIFIKRTANVGVVSKQLAIGYALSGPMIRGSGIPLDLRRDRPYSAFIDRSNSTSASAPEPKARWAIAGTAIG